MNSGSTPAVAAGLAVAVAACGKPGEPELGLSGEVTLADGTRAPLDGTVQAARSGDTVVFGETSSQGGIGVSITIDLSRLTAPGTYDLAKEASGARLSFTMTRGQSLFVLGRGSVVIEQLGKAAGDLISGSWSDVYRPATDGSGGKDIDLGSGSFRVQVP